MSHSNSSRGTGAQNPDTAADGGVNIILYYNIPGTIFMQ